jgi:protoporphyrinogen oxidase
MTHDTDVLVLGGGLAGLATASALGARAIVLEREAEAGGLVRTLARGGYWFDHVLHLLYFADPDTERRVHAMMGADLQPCPPEAWVESMSGRARFPFQGHLRELPADVIARCLTDLAATTFGPASPPAANYEEMLLRTFGRAMCDEFFFPYNRKMWKRPLDGLSASGFHWNIQRPDFESVVKGSLPQAAAFAPYNARGWYPRPSQGPRGMGALSHALARHVHDVRFGHGVQSIDPTRREVVTQHDGHESRFHYRHALVCTLPLPVTLGLVRGLPRDLAAAPARLPYNRVLTPCFSVRGPRPKNTGHWRYFTDPSLSFTRLVFMHRFDPASAPRDGWGLMAEVTQPAGQPVPDRAEVLARVRGEIERVGVLPRGSTIVDAHVEVCEYGYVVFEHHVERLVQRALSVLRGLGIHPVGRYGRWEYSSMAQVMRDGFAQGDALLHELEAVPEPELAPAR